jgi:hypothetical protein
MQPPYIEDEFYKLCPPVISKGGHLRVMKIGSHETEIEKEIQERAEHYRQSLRQKLLAHAPSADHGSRREPVIKGEMD